MTVLALFENIQGLEKALDSLWKMLDGHFWVLSLELSHPAGLNAADFDQMTGQPKTLKACHQQASFGPPLSPRLPLLWTPEDAPKAEPDLNLNCPKPVQLSAEEWQQVAYCLRGGGCALLLQPQTPKNAWISLFHEAGAQQVMTVNGGKI